LKSATSKRKADPSQTTLDAGDFSFSTLRDRKPKKFAKSMSKDSKSKKQLQQQIKKLQLEKEQLQMSLRLKNDTKKKVAK
jgi:hypothetical protein